MLQIDFAMSYSWEYHNEVPCGIQNHWSFSLQQSLTNQNFKPLLKMAKTKGTGILDGIGGRANGGNLHFVKKNAAKNCIW